MPLNAQRIDHVSLILLAMLFITRPPASIRSPLCNAGNLWLLPVTNSRRPPPVRKATTLLLPPRKAGDERLAAPLAKMDKHWTDLITLITSCSMTRIEAANPTQRL